MHLADMEQAIMFPALEPLYAGTGKHTGSMWSAIESYRHGNASGAVVYSFVVVLSCLEEHGLCRSDWELTDFAHMAPCIGFDTPSELTYKALVNILRD